MCWKKWQKSQMIWGTDSGLWLDIQQQNFKPLYWPRAITIETYLARKILSDSKLHKYNDKSCLRKG